MSETPQPDLSGVSMLELFRSEAETQCGLLTSGLLELERGAATDEVLASLMRAAHSIKGAARIVNLSNAVQVAHALEDCLVAAQRHELGLGRAEVDGLLKAVDVLSHLAKYGENDIDRWQQDYAPEIKSALGQMAELRARAEGVRAQPAMPIPIVAESSQPPGPPVQGAAPETVRPGTQLSTVQSQTPERVVRLNAENLNRLLALAGESLVESRWLSPFTESLGRLNRLHNELAQDLSLLRKLLAAQEPGGVQGPPGQGYPRITANLTNGLTDHMAFMSGQLAECRQLLLEKMQELELFDRRSANLSNRLYLEVLRTRMRPFSEGVRRFPRMVRDVARALGKEVKLEIFGESTPVDRDILERLETPLAHLLRNAVDHGCETPQQRQTSGKPAESTIRLEARHSAGVLLVTVTDDGAGIDPERIRKTIVERELATAATAQRLTESELLEYLFLPGFSLKEKVTEISGRGVGLDIVQNMVKSVRGSIRVNNLHGRGLRLQLQLPLTLSVVRSLLVEVGGEPYALPLTQLVRALQLSATEVRSLEGRPYFRFGEQQIGLLAAYEVLGCAEPATKPAELPVIVIGDRNARHGLIVDRFLGERELVVQPLDERLGKVPNVSAAALMEDGNPVLILDFDQLLRSIEKLLAEGPQGKLGTGAEPAARRRQKRVLVVDDSLTIREVERKLLSDQGYLTDIAADGIEGWQAARTGQYDLVITDVDMPRLDGIELAGLIKRDPGLKHVSVIIISYKDREDHRSRGLETGADNYLAKGTYNNETLLEAVKGLIGDPHEALELVSNGKDLKPSGAN